MPIAEFPRAGRQVMATPLTGVMQSGEGLKHLVSRHLAQANDGLVMDLLVTPSVMYAAVQRNDGSVEACIYPYSTDYSLPAPREVRYGAYSERDNPEWAFAPPRILNRLSPTEDMDASVWRSRCWAHQLMLRESSDVLQAGDVFQLTKQKETDAGHLEPGFYALVRRADDYGVVRPLDGPSNSIVVPNLSSVMNKIVLTADPKDRLQHFPQVVSFAMTSVGRDDVHGTMYVLLGRTASGMRIPLAKADSGNYEAILKSVWELSKDREQLMRAYRGDDLYQYAMGHGLMNPMLAQRNGEPVPFLDDLKVVVADSPEELHEVKAQSSDAILNLDDLYDGPSM